MATGTASSRVRVAAGVAAGALWCGSLALGRTGFAAVTAVLCVLGYLELRRMLARRSPASLALGSAAVVALCVTGNVGRPEDLPWIVAALLVSTLATRVVLVELGRAELTGATADVAGTLTAACVTGLLGSHAVLVRSTSRFGLRGAIAFAALVVSWSAATAVAGSRSPGARLLSGSLAAVVAGAVCGTALDPPLTPGAGTGLGVAVAVLAPVGSRAVASIVEASGESPGVLSLLAGPLVCAPAFYWIFRTLVL